MLASSYKIQEKTTDICKTTSGFSAVWEKTTEISSERNKIQSNGESFSESKARNLYSCCTSLNSPTKRGCFIYSNIALWQVGRGERLVRKTTQKGYVYNKTVSCGSRERGARSRKEQSERYIKSIAANRYPLPVKWVSGRLGECSAPKYWRRTVLLCSLK